MGNTIDTALIKQLENAIDLYVHDDVKTDVSRAAIIALLTNYLSRLNDINFLIENHRFSSSKVLMRVAFETNTYIRYIFEKNNEIEKRAKAYYYRDFQKIAYYLQHLDQTDIASSAELIKIINESDNPKLLNKYRNVNEYFNDRRTKFRACFAIDNSKLSFDKLNDNEPFKAFSIDSWKWYNDNGHTRTFFDLIRRLNLLNEYAALYVPTSDDVHSDGLQRNLRVSSHSLKIVQSFDPNMLVFFNVSILGLLEIIEKHIHNTDTKSQVSSIIRSARAIYYINHQRK